MYIDPGSGSFLIQAVIATLVAVPIIMRHQIARAFNAIRGLGGSSSNPARSETAGTVESAPAGDTVIPDGADRGA
jgi:hypothetical protein